nr:VENN motif pre-toxin domain-containing protein [Klebsiella africana]
MAAYGTGSDLQRGIQAATAALQGLAGGDIAGALAGASAPELANLIGHGSGLSDGAAVVAHAILGGAVAALQGNSAAAGAAGAAAGELAARAIAGMLYPGVTDLSTLTEAQKQTVSTLATISAGMAGGLAGDSTASAAAGAQGGKNAVENNALGNVLAAANSVKPGTTAKWQEEQQAAIKEACSGDTPVSCQMAVAAMGTVMSGGLLPEAMVISGAISAGAVGSIDYAMNGSVDPKNVIAAYWVGALTRSTGLEATIAINAAGGATTSYLDGKNPWVGGLVSGLTGGVAYGVGNKVVEPAMDEVFNPVWKILGWDDIGMGISKPVQPSLWPSVAGATSGTSGGEYISNKVNDKIDEAKSNNGGNNK